MKARIVYGCLPDSLTPDHLRLMPDSSNAAYIADWRNWPQELWDKAKEHCAAAYFRVDGPHDHFDNARIALVQGQAEGQAIIAFGIWENEWNRVGPDGIIPAVPSPLIGYHCYVILGFGKINGREYIAAQNSYGTSFGKAGIQYFDRATFNRIWDGLGADRELFIYRDVSPETIAAQKRSLLVIYLELAIRLAQATLAAALKGLFSPRTTPEPRPAPEPVPALEDPPEPKPAPSKIPLWAEAIAQHEGGGPEYATNPGNIKFSEYTASLGALRGRPATDGGYFCRFADREAGMNALRQLLRDACSDNLKAYRSTMTLRDFTKVYAHPPNDNYANGVAKALGVTVDTRIRTLL